MKTPKKVSLREIAEQAGVSRMTVSKALRGTRGVSADTTERIKEIARKLGYKPDPKVAMAMAAVAKAAQSSSGERIAFLTTHQTAEGWKKYPHITRCFKGASERALEFGYELEAFWALRPGVKLADVLYARGIDGILLAPTGPELLSEGRRTIDFDWSRSSVVEVDEQLDEPHFRIVRHDHFSAMLKALHQLESLGYRRIGLALSRETEARNRHRWSSAYLLWTRVRNFNKEIPLFLYDDDEPKAIGQWAKKNAVEAVLGLPSEYLMLKEAGFNCPDDLGFALLDRQKIPGEKTLCSGIDQDGQSIGAAAIDLLVGLLRTGEVGPPPNPVKLVCEGRWMAGRSTREVGPPINERNLYEIPLPL